MNDQKTLYVVLRADRKWEGVSTTLLDLAEDGALTLARVPGLAAGHEIEIAGPYDVDASGLALGADGDVYVADTSANRVTSVDGICKARMILPGCKGASGAPGNFSDPRGLLFNPPGGLYVADSSNARVQVFKLPSLELRSIWEGFFNSPTGLAADGLQRVYVLDRGLKRIMRFSAWGVPDDPFNAAMVAQPDLTSPAFMTIDAEGVLYVSDDLSNRILKFDPDGQLLGLLSAAGAAQPFRPRALAAHERRLYVADGESGFIWVFDLSVDGYRGTVVGYKGPVTAMAVDATGTLYLKPEAGDEVHHIADDTSFVPSGHLSAGPFDAGERSEWERVSVHAESSAGNAVRLQTFATDDPSAMPTEADWVEALSLDTLIRPATFPGTETTVFRRYLWLRALLTSDDRRASPRLLQVGAETAGEDYMDYLPSIYQLEEPEHGFLERWLAMFRSELGDLELMLEDLPARLNPALADEEYLRWLAGWLAFEMPQGSSIEEMRSLLLRVSKLYDRRGTPFGLREFVRLYTGARPHIVEAFRHRRVWQLGYTSALGFDTGLAPFAVDGMVAPDSSLLHEGDRPWGCAVPERLVVGETVVGASGPLEASDLGEHLFSDAAHQFTVLINAAHVSEHAKRQTMRRVIEAEKPAHTDYHLCFVEARMRVGFQATVGVDSIIAGPPEPMALAGTVLGMDSVLGEGESEDGVGRVGKHARVGRDTVLG